MLEASVLDPLFASSCYLRAHGTPNLGQHLSKAKQATDWEVKSSSQCLCGRRLVDSSIGRVLSPVG